MSKLGRQLEGVENLLKRPHVTEKSSRDSIASGLPAGRQVYTFEIPAQVNKGTVMAAVKKLYGVKPAKVNIVKLPAKKIMVRGKRGTKPAIKKALVFLKKGDKIDFV